MKKLLSCGASAFVLAGPAFAQLDAVADQTRNVRGFEACMEAAAGASGDEIVLCSQRINRLTVVEVVGDRYIDDPGSVAILADTIDAIAADHPAEVLNTLPGVNIHTNSGQEHLIAIRSPVLTGGAGQGSFLILENGVPTRASAFGNVNALLEPHHETAGAIEVVRGPGSARYGSNAVHGLINVIQAAPEGQNALDVNASYSSLNRYRADLVANTEAGLRAALSLQDEVGWRDDTGLQQQRLTITGDFGAGEWELAPFLSISNLNQETAGFIEGDDAYKDEDIATANPNPEAYRDAFSARAHLRATRSFDGGDLTLIPFARSQEMEFNLHFLPYPGIEENGHDSAGLLARYDVFGGENWSGTLGADIEGASGYLIETQTAPFGFFPGDARFPVGRHYDYEVDTRMGALWGEAVWEPSVDVRVVFGLRAESHHYDYTTNIPAMVGGRFRVPEDRTDSFTLLTPKLGAIWDLGNVSLYANYARGQRAPQASDLYKLQSRQIPGQVETETLDSFEIGTRGAALDGALVFDVAAYIAEKENFFFRDGDGLNVPDGATEHSGIEAAFDWQLIEERLSLSGQVSWSDQNYTFDRSVASASNSITNGDEIDSAPEWLGDLALVFTPTDALTFRLSAEHVGEYVIDPAGTRDYPGHTVANARAEWAVSDALSAYLIVRNLTDERYADRADFAFGDERYFPGEPLNATVGIRARFE